MPLARQTVMVAIDFEGTGKVQAHPDEPWQLGLVALHNGCTVPQTAFESLLRVGERPFNRYAPGRHEELREAMKTAPTLPQLWQTLKPRIEGAVLVAHNAATEKRYLHQAFPLHPPPYWLDTLKLARIAWPRLSSYKLEDLLDRLQLSARVQTAMPTRAPHDALYDAFACAILLEHLLAQPGWQHATLEALIRARP